MQTSLRVKQLRSAYAGPFELLLDKGACAAITGPSGSGKSLFLRMIADLDPNLIESTRQHWPFLRDRRIDAYEGIAKRFLD